MPTNSIKAGFVYQEDEYGADLKDGKNYKGSTATNWTSAMLTAEVHW